MRIAIVSDIHDNLTSFEAELAASSENVWRQIVFKVENTDDSRLIDQR